MLASLLFCCCFVDKPSWPEEATPNLQELPPLNYSADFLDIQMNIQDLALILKLSRISPLRFQGLSSWRSSV